MRIAICDDNPIIVEELHRKLNTTIQKLDMNALIADFTDADDLFYEIETTGIFDIIFLDIEIGKTNGIEFAARLNREKYVYTLIFISQYPTYYKAAFEVQPFWFLDKPFEEDKLECSLRRALDSLKYRYETFNYFYAKEYYRVLVENIMYVQSNLRTILLYCEDGRMRRFYGKLDEVEEELRTKHQKFIRVNRSVCVNINYVSKWTFKYIELLNGEIINISEKYRDTVRDSFLQRIREKVKYYGK